MTHYDTVVWLSNIRHQNIRKEQHSLVALYLLASHPTDPTFNSNKASIQVISYLGTNSTFNPYDLLPPHYSTNLTQSQKTSQICYKSFELVLVRN
ncbi:hypothetical protein CEXT_186701 [Caerostris extrusa]|uniref:Uncharacterized protein n=1 Tax=Caerostris extrusa TaxID=172846 RepID=A0AAV4YAD0_CAEEX|nr:hypothetical protein CEXT_186701 [Caerostris extrusa]